MPELTIGQIKVPYEIEWKPERDSLGLSINQSKEITVKAPTSSEVSDIEEFLDRKKSWILEKINEVEKLKEKPLEKEFLSGEKLLYKGRRYRLKVNNPNIEEPRLDKKDNKFILDVPEDLNGEERTNEIKKAVKSWYKEKAEQFLSSRADHFKEKIGEEFEKVSIRELNKEWGYVKDREIRLHWKAIMAPVNIQDYLIVHELAHLKEENHSDRFWNIVGSLIPDYKERIEWLRVNGPALNI